MALPEAPNSRSEQYLAKIAGQVASLPEAPNSRVEQYLEYIAENGIVSEEEIAEQVSEWLEDNIHEDPTVVIDASLSVSGAAADAKKAGDGINDVGKAFSYLVGLTPYYFTMGGYYTTPDSGGTPTFTESADWCCTRIPFVDGDTVVINASAGAGTQRLYCLMDANGESLGRSGANLTGERTYTTHNASASELVINNKLTSQSRNYYAYKGTESVTTKFENTISSKSKVPMTDLNSVTNSGFYSWSSTDTKPSNTPALLQDKAFQLWVYKPFDVSVRTVQIIIPLSTNPFINIHYRFSSSSDWSNWYVMTSTGGEACWCFGKTVNWIGDSIVSGGDFDELVSDALGMTDNDYGISGSTIALAEDGTDGRNAIVLRYSSMADDADIVAISAGTNDFQYAWCPIGDINSTSNSTFYGAMKNLCEGLIAKYPKKVIFFTTPIKRAQAFSNGNGGTYTADGIPTTPFSKNKYGKTLMDYCDIIKEVCGYYSIPVLDLNRESLMNPHISAQADLFDDDTHPSSLGRRIQARRVAGWLIQLGHYISE